ncbi:hypothetical protein TKK_0003814 [Trichogramma kaykai]|uniref:Golgin-84 n=1 Tax=Trichogramma kaykai TaxID=54128 RepID=A0ABD2XP16_9HYME
MAWLSDLAGKAEEMLNNIDKTTAAVLKKDDGAHGRTHFLSRDDDSCSVEVRSLPPSDTDQAIANEFIRDAGDRFAHLKSPYSSKTTISAPTTPSHGDKSMKVQVDSFTWLDEAKNSTTVPQSTVHFVNEEKKHSYDNDISRDYNKLDAGSISQNNVVDYELDPNFNFTLNTKIASAVAEKEQQLKSEFAKEIESLNEKVNSLTTEKINSEREISNLNAIIERTRSELKSVESELDQHRARALKTLQERDKLILELRNNSSSSQDIDDTSVLVELDQLRQERETLREENRQVREKLRLARQEAIDADLNAEKIRQRAVEASIQAKEAVASERRKRLDAEEDAKLRSEETRSLREELTLRQTTFSAKLQKQEAEISRLRAQFSAAVSPSAEAEARLSSLTRTLVLKQQEVEHLTTDRNALRLQLERLEHEYQNWKKNAAFNSVNDTDDAKALLPSFLVESPFDTGVTRRVKRAYTSLDSLGIRIGVFLRRYPLVRILVLLYIVVLNLWVLFLLFSQSPEAR